MAASQMPWRVTGDAVVLSVHLTPRAAHDRIDGTAALPGGPAIKARVRAIPEDGKANAALETLIADWLDVAKRCVRVTSGHTSRLKSVTITAPLEAVVSTMTRCLALEAP